MEKERHILPVTIQELEVIIEGLKLAFQKVSKKIKREHIKHNFKDDVELNTKLALTQETLQYVTLIYNIRVGKLSKVVAEAGGLAVEENVNITGDSPLDGDEGAESTDTRRRETTNLFDKEIIDS